MADNLNFGEYLDEIFADEDSDYEFEGFDLDDVNENPEVVINECITNENWVAGEHVPLPLNFSGSQGFFREINDKTSPIEYFENFINDQDIQEIVQETNLYAAQSIASKNVSAYSRFNKWIDTTLNEMRRFIALLFTMTLVCHSPQLFSDLWELGVGATGTVRPNRKGVPDELKNLKLRAKGETAVVNKRPLNLTKYLDHKPVYMLSTVSTSENIDTNRKDPWTGENIIRPKVVFEYNSKMGGVDRSDQMISYCKIPIKTMKWWKKVIFHMFSMAALNSYLIYKSTTTERSPLLFRNYRRKFIKQLIEKSNDVGLHEAKKSAGRPSGKQLERLTGRHFAEKIIPTGTKLTLTRRCIVCTPAERELLASAGEKHRRPGRDTSFNCAECNVALCIDPCFKLYHKYKEYNLAYKRQKLAAGAVRNSLPFLEYELHNQLMNKLKLRGMNGLFGLRIQISVGDTYLIGIAVSIHNYLMLDN
ncbi:unnamed protein product [Mytilus edulis]|uniref:PiggyBac transposable element-derived protein domain-containing protein n=1 Tax=Mytilus edulis TaxID=6550 RepID=A0A8S3SW07_MYTED|nr:unnamed protein product [Mytilus edulis]